MEYVNYKIAYFKYIVRTIISRNYDSDRTHRKGNGHVIVILSTTELRERMFHQDYFLALDIQIRITSTSYDELFLLKESDNVDEMKLLAIHVFFLR